MGNVTVRPRRPRGKGAAPQAAAVVYERLWRVTLKVWVPSEDVGLLVGPGGSFVKAIRDETRAQVQMVCDLVTAFSAPTHTASCAAPRSLIGTQTMAHGLL